ncbi:uncharacterized protein B0H18DRAFT_175758 [Fomitopsis serialis]|uniref:uncharacterized protein n=1 Tax=Fomitopsis serialis TaxID=139415 RepID=UPI002008EB7D|nr:uncharacterized protein B0H18DRAFT_175758 [Neoantrodia serialis]KAH9929823.1 hypothetical protein B0H18DRAFT_175758 [Neoantrodia serialis]
MALPPGVTFTDEALDYTRCIQACLTTYDQEVDIQRMLCIVLNMLHSRTASDVRSGAEAGNPKDILELGIRLCKGCGVPAKDVEEAINQWRRLTDPAHAERLSSPPSRRIVAQAYSCIAYAYNEKSCLPNRTLQIDDLKRAAEAADASVGLGFISPTALFIAQFLTTRLLESPVMA